jgi:hypothetical protein
MMPPKTSDLFRGNGTAEKAHTWLRTLEQTWKYDADEKEKLYRFEKGLHPGGQAEEWWTSLGATERKDWTALMAAFEKKWAKPKPTRRAQDVVIQELMTNCLDREDLGKYVNDEDGVSVLSHIAWAEVTRKLLGELVGGDAAMMLKSSVRATLPVEFRHLIIDTGLDTWEKYLKAVEDVGIDRINDAVEERTTRHDKILMDSMAWYQANPNATATQRRLGDPVCREPRTHPQRSTADDHASSKLEGHVHPTRCPPIPAGRHDDQCNPSDGTPSRPPCLPDPFHCRPPHTVGKSHVQRRLRWHHRAPNS